MILPIARGHHRNRFQNKKQVTINFQVVTQGGAIQEVLLNPLFLQIYQYIDMAFCLQCSVSCYCYSLNLPNGTDFWNQVYQCKKFSAYRFLVFRLQCFHLGYQLCYRCRHVLQCLRLLHFQRLLKLLRISTPDELLLPCRRLNFLPHYAACLVLYLFPLILVLFLFLVCCLSQIHQR